MPGALQKEYAPLDVEAFRNWVASRPDEERWELIDGVPMMMAPATRDHQRIASNLERLLNDALERSAAGGAVRLAAYQRLCRRAHGRPQRFAALRGTPGDAMADNVQKSNLRPPTPVEPAQNQNNGCVVPSSFLQQTARDGATHRQASRILLHASLKVAEVLMQLIQREAKGK